MGHQVPDKIVSLENSSDPIIVVFYAPVSEGNIYYRETSTDQAMLKELTVVSKVIFPENSDTWSNIRNAEKDGLVSFKLVILSDGVSTFAVFLYNQLSWSSSMGYYAQTGFGKLPSNERYCNPSVKKLINTRNWYFYRISDTTIKGSCDKYFNGNKYATTGRGTPSCTRPTCDANAICLPEPSGGSKCVCKAGFIGNGAICKKVLANHQKMAASRKRGFMFQ